MLFEVFLQELAKAMRFNDLKADAQGACEILIKEGDISLLFEFDDQLVPNTILLSAPVSDFPSEHRAAIYAAILAGNMGLEETLSIKPDDDLCFLHIRFNPQIQAAEIEQMLKSFVLKVKEWKQKIEAISNTRPPPPKSSIPPPTFKVLPYKG